MALALQKELFEPEQYLQNQSGRAYFALLRSEPGRSYKKQTCYPVDSMHAVLQALGSADREHDTWISQAEFYAPTRRLVHLSKLALLFTDLDTYKLNITAGPEQQSELLLRLCEDIGLPEPSLIVFSGRGLQAKWLLQTALPQAALPRWNAVQAVINERLQSFGADARALDACRVLRLVQTVNTKSGEVVRVLHYSNVRYDFDTLAKQLLPFDRSARKPVSEGQLVLLRPGPGEKHRVSDTSGLRRFLGFQLAWDRLADLRTLAMLRKGKAGAVPDGQRDCFVFLAAVFLAQATVDTARFYDELRVLAREFVSHWTDAQARDAASAALARMRAYVAGQRIEFGGQHVDPRYRFRNETLISERWLNVTVEEEKQLLTIISERESRARDAARARQKRSDAGAITRQAYESGAEQKRATGRLMRAQGASWQDVAEAVGYKNAEAARKSCK
jgi:hypothetical protein